MHAFGQQVDALAPDFRIKRDEVRLGEEIEIILLDPRIIKRTHGE